MKAKRLVCALLVISLAEAVAQQPVTTATTNAAKTTAFGDPIVGFIGTNQNIAASVTPPPGFVLVDSPQAARKEFQRIKAEAEKGDATNEYNLGQTYAEEKNFVEAVKWWRKAAEQNVAEAQHNLGACYFDGRGVAKDAVEAVKWFRKAAEQNLAEAQLKLFICYAAGQGVERDTVQAVKWFSKVDSVEAVKFFSDCAEQNLAIGQYFLGLFYENGVGVAKDAVEAVKWYRKAAEQNDATAQYRLGLCYAYGNGIAMDYVEAVNWYRKAAEQNDADAQCALGTCYYNGSGVAKDYVEAYKWLNLALAQGNQLAKNNLSLLERYMTPAQIADAQQLSREFKPRIAPEPGVVVSSQGIADSRPSGSGSGFFITEDGFLVTNEHVVKDASQLRLVTSAGIKFAKVVKLDATTDLALLKAEGKFAALPVASSRSMKMGATVATVGFPNIGLQGFAPKLAKGEIASLSGAADDPRYFQISAPVQPGNSGGALVDEHGNVVGVVSAKLDAAAALTTSGALPENVNYAVKSSFLLGFLESVPDVSAKLKDPNTKERKFEDVVKSAEQSAVLVLVY